MNDILGVFEAEMFTNSTLSDVVERKKETFVRCSGFGETCKNKSYHLLTGYMTIIYIIKAGEICWQIYDYSWSLTYKQRRISCTGV